MQDLNEPIPEPPHQQPLLNQVNELICWLCCFIMYWQVVTHVSDAAVEWLLAFLGRFLQTLSFGLDSEFFSNLMLLSPTNIYMLHRISNLKRDEFENLLSAPNVQSCIIWMNALKESMEQFSQGSAVTFCFPKGKQSTGSKLVNKVILKNGATKFYPLKVYCWKSIISQLESILQRTGIPELCEQWRTRQVEESVLSDVYDGEVWKNFKWKDGSHFFNLEHRYGLMLNVDWFQPFKRRSDYSVGVIYFVIMNLPWSQRFKFENVILGGIILSLESEPKLHTFLDPCVDELNGLWREVLMSTSLSSAPLRVIAALLCVAADIPATRKACGFVGHSANRACSKCFKLFIGGFGEKKDFSGFQDCLSWPKRDRMSHNRNCEGLKLLRASLNMASCHACMVSTTVHYANLNTLTVFDFMSLIQCTVCFLELPSMSLSFGLRMYLARAN